MPTITIIIPCFNGWRFFTKCLDSLSRQSKYVDEIIIIDDCSTDDSYAQLEKYVKKTNLNIKLFQNQDNVGPGKTRERAIKEATSDYITFCDCDDWYEDTFLKEVKECMQRNKYDLLIFDSFTCFPNGDRKVDHISTGLVNHNKPFILANYPMSLCRLVVRRDLFKNIIHSQLRNGEDGIVVTQLISKADSIQVIDKPFYNYFYRNDSASKSPNKQAYMDMYRAFQMIYQLIDKEFEAEIEYLGINYVCYGSMLTGVKAKVSKNELWHVMDSFESIYPNWFNNHYLPNIGRSKKTFLFFCKKRKYALMVLTAKFHPLFVRIKALKSRSKS